MRPLEGRFVKMPVARRKERLLNDAAFDEQRECAIDGCQVRVSHAGAPQLVDEIAHLEMTVVRQGRARDRQGAFSRFLGRKTHLTMVAEIIHYVRVQQLAIRREQP